MNQSVNVDQLQDYVSVLPRPNAERGYSTHDVHNMPPEIPDLDLFQGDEVLVSALAREGAGWASNRLQRCGKTAGSSRMRELAHLANVHLPVLKTHNRIGQRIDFVEYHPAYHELMAATLSTEIHSLPWTSKEENAHLARAMISYLWNQVEGGTMCPTVMSFSIIPLLKSDPAIGNS